MNERIELLAIKAGIYGGVDINGNFENEAEVKRFAELIVEDNERLLKMSFEALRYMKADYLRKDGLGFDLIASSKMFDALKKLEEHFGVKE